jgi:hypothetical protein
VRQHALEAEVNAHNPTNKDYDKLAASIPEAARVANSSRSALYEAIRRGELVARKNGRRTIILIDDLRDYLQRLKPIR